MAGLRDLLNPQIADIKDEAQSVQSQYTPVPEFRPAAPLPMREAPPMNLRDGGYTPIAQEYDPQQPTGFAAGVTAGGEDIAGTANVLLGNAQLNMGFTDSAIESMNRASEYFQRSRGRLRGQSISDMNSIGDFSNALAEQAGRMLPTLVSAISGGGAFGAAAQNLLGSMAKKGMVKKGLQGLGAIEGSMLGEGSEYFANLTLKGSPERNAWEQQMGMSVDGDVATNAEGIAMTLSEQLGANMVAAHASGALNFMPLAGAIRKLPTKNGQQLFNDILRRATNTAVGESVTEVAQTAIEQSVAHYINTNRDLISDQNEEELLTAAALAFPLGFIGGGIGGGVRGMQDIVSREQQQLIDAQNAFAKAGKGPGILDDGYGGKEFTSESDYMDEAGYMYTGEDVPQSAMEDLGYVIDPETGDISYADSVEYTNPIELNTEGYQFGSLEEKQAYEQDLANRKFRTERAMQNLNIDPAVFGEGGPLQGVTVGGYPKTLNKEAPLKQNAITALDALKNAKATVEEIKTWGETLYQKMFDDTYEGRTQANRRQLEVNTQQLEPEISRIREIFREADLGQDSASLIRTRQLQSQIAKLKEKTFKDPNSHWAKKNSEKIAELEKQLGKEKKGNQISVNKALTLLNIEIDKNLAVAEQLLNNGTITRRQAEASVGGLSADELSNIRAAFGAQPDVETVELTDQQKQNLVRAIKKERERKSASKEDKLTYVKAMVNNDMATINNLAKNKSKALPFTSDAGRLLSSRGELIRRGQANAAKAKEATGLPSYEQLGGAEGVLSLFPVEANFTEEAMGITPDTVKLDSDEVYGVRKTAGGKHQTMVVGADEKNIDERYYVPARVRQEDGSFKPAKVNLLTVGQLSDTKFQAQQMQGATSQNRMKTVLDGMRAGVAALATDYGIQVNLETVLRDFPDTIVHKSGGRDVTIKQLAAVETAGTPTHKGTSIGQGSRSNEFLAGDREVLQGEGIEHVNRNDDEKNTPLYRDRYGYNLTNTDGTKILITPDDTQYINNYTNKKKAIESAKYYRDQMVKNFDKLIENAQAKLQKVKEDHAVNANRAERKHANLLDKHMKEELAIMNRKMSNAQKHSEHAIKKAMLLLNMSAQIGHEAMIDRRWRYLGAAPKVRRKQQRRAKLGYFQSMQSLLARTSEPLGASLNELTYYRERRDIADAQEKLDQLLAVKKKGKQKQYAENMYQHALAAIEYQFGEENKSNVNVAQQVNDKIMAAPEAVETKQFDDVLKSSSPSETQAWIDEQYQRGIKYGPLAFVNTDNYYQLYNDLASRLMEIKIQQEEKAAEHYRKVEQDAKAFQTKLRPGRTHEKPVDRKKVKSTTLEAAAAKDAMPEQVKLRADFQAIANKILANLGITSINLKVVDSAGLIYASPVSEAKIKSGALQGKVAFNKDDTLAVLYVNPFMTKAEQYRFFAHELAHVIVTKAFDSASYSTQNAIIRDWERWLEMSGAPKELIEEIIAKRELADAAHGVYTGTSKQKMRIYQEYALSFDEYMAEQVADWLLTNKRPQSVVDKFFKQIAAAISYLWRSVAQKPTQNVDEWLNTLWDKHQNAASKEAVKAYRDARDARLKKETLTTRKRNEIKKRYQAAYDALEKLDTEISQNKRNVQDLRNAQIKINKIGRTTIAKLIKTAKERGKNVAQEMLAEELGITDLKYIRQLAPYREIVNAMASKDSNTKVVEKIARQLVQYNALIEKARKVEEEKARTKERLYRETARALEAKVESHLEKVRTLRRQQMARKVLAQQNRSHEGQQTSSKPKKTKTPADVTVAQAAEDIGYDIKDIPWMANILSQNEKLQALGFLEAFDNFLKPEEREIILKATDSYYVRQQLERAYKNRNPQILQIIRTDPRRAAAYAFVLHRQGKLDFGRKAGSIIHRILRWVADFFGIVTVSDNADLLFAFMSGYNMDVLNARTVDPEVLLYMPKQLDRTMSQKMFKAARPVFESAGRYLGKVALPTAMRFSKNPYIQQALRLVYVDQSRAYQQSTFHENKDIALARLTMGLEKALGPLVEDEGRMLQLLRHMQKGTKSTDMYVDEGMRRVRKWLDSIGGYAKTRGVDLKYLHEYFPLVFDVGHIQARPEVLVDLIAKYMPDKKILKGKTKQETAQMIVDAIIMNDGATEFDSTSEHGMKNPYMDAFHERTLKWLTDNKEARAKLAEFQSDNLFHVLGTYTRQVVRRSEYVNTFGENGAKYYALLEKARKNGATENEIREAEDFMDGILGLRSVEFVRKHPKWAKAIEAMSVYQAMRTLGTAVFASLADVGGLYMRGGFRNATDAMIKGLSSQDYRYAEDIGAVDRALTQDLLAQGFDTSGFTGKSAKVADWFFTINGMVHWTRATRAMGTTLANRMFYAWSQDLNNPDVQRNMAEMGLKPEDLTFYTVGEDHYLRTLSVQRETEYRIKLNDPNTSEKDKVWLMIALENNDRRLSAINRFVNSSILRPDSPSRPNWANDPRYHLFFQLKGFMYKFWDVYHRRVFNDIMYSDKYNSLGMMMLFAPMFLMSEVLRDLAQHFGDDPRKDKWTAFDHVWEATERSGVIGPFEFATQLADDFKYGNIPGESLSGPTVEWALDWFRAASGQRSVSTQTWRSVPGQSLIYPEYKALFGNE